MKNKTKIFFIIFFLLNMSALKAQGGEQISLRGYVKALPGVRFDREFQNPAFDNIIHNRLNFRWNVASDFRMVLEGRNRLFYNTLFRDYPFLVEMIDVDHGLFDLSWIWWQDGGWIGHTEIDRIFLDYRINNWQFRAGRQRINWGINLVSNPNDLFNTYSFFDIDYEERPGADALRVQYHTGYAGRIEMAYSPAEDIKNSVGALLWATSLQGIDFQVLAGYFKNRSAVGAGWATSLGGAGFKGEATWFYDLQEMQGKKRGTLVAATGVDYMFATGTFGVLEFLYNGGYTPFQDLSFILGQPLSPDNIMLSEYAITISLNHPFSPVFSGGLATMALPDQKSFFISPNLAYSLIPDLDLEFISQIFVGARDSLFRNAGSAWYISLRYSF